MTKLNLQNLIVSLEELASREFQERTWLATEAAEVSSFSELVSQTFDDTGLSDVLDENHLKTIVGEDATLALEELDRAISRVNQSLSPAGLIDHPSMQRVRASARQALQLLKSVTNEDLR